MLVDYNPDLLVNPEQHRLLLPREDNEKVQAVPVAGDEAGNETQATKAHGECKGPAPASLSPKTHIGETGDAARTENASRQQGEELEEHFKEGAVFCSDGLRTYLRNIQALCELEETGVTCA